MKKTTLVLALVSIMALALSGGIFAEEKSGGKSSLFEDRGVEATKHMPLKQNEQDKQDEMRTERAPGTEELERSEPVPVYPEKEQSEE